MAIETPGKHLGQLGWREIGIALVLYLLGIGLLAFWYSQVPDERTLLRINLGGAMNFAAGLAALCAAWVLRVRDWQAFGFRRAASRWLLGGIVLGVVAFGLSFIVEAVYFRFVTEPNTQADFQLAAQSGRLSLALVLFTGAVMGPIGEELVFRGVIYSALARYGAVTAVVGSAFLFALIHGPSVIFFDALMVGILAGMVVAKAGSIWPAIALHIVYNGLHILHYSTG